MFIQVGWVLVVCLQIENLTDPKLWGLNSSIGSNIIVFHFSPQNLTANLGITYQHSERTLIKIHRKKPVLASKRLLLVQ